jgi:heterodisulfide reductase subunit A
LKNNPGDLESLLQSDGALLSFPEIDAEYRVEKIQTPVCRVNCPAGVNIKSYIGLIAEHKFSEALQVVRATNPLPGICGRVCTHPCESECNRGEVDDPVAICALKRFVADYELEHKKKTRPQPIKQTRKKKVAIVGSGPAGLTAGNDLVRMGYGVTIFEALPVAGGMLSSCIPPFRLPREIIQTEIDSIRDLGVDIKTESRVEDIEGLLKKGYSAVFVAVGAYEGLKLGVPGEDEFKGVVDCIQFLVDVNLGKKKKKPGKNAVIIGGGNSAIDSARTALRLGCDEVHIVYRRSRKEMPANAHEIEEAEKEGVKIHFLAAPVRILGEKGKATGMECIKMKLGEPDASGRQRPIPIEGSEFIVNADFIVPAISQRPDLSFLPEKHNFKITKWNSFQADEKTLETGVPGVFAGGDAVTGPSTVIDAIAAGHKAASSIDRYLRGEKLKPACTLPVTAGLQLVIDGYSHEEEKRAMVPSIPLKERKSFREVESALDEETAVKEAKRCLRCGPCVECDQCVSSCWKKLLAVEAGEGDGEVEDLLIQIPWAPDRFPAGYGPWTANVRVGRKSEKAVVTEPILSKVAESRCRGCGKCVEVCEYRAPKLTEVEGRLCARIDPLLCRGCGTCSPVCPSSAIEAVHFSDSRLEGLLSREK